MTITCVDRHGNVFFVPKDTPCCIYCRPCITVKVAFSQKYTTTEQKICFLAGTTIGGTIVGAIAGAGVGATIGAAVGLTAGLIKLAIDEFE